MLVGAFLSWFTLSFNPAQQVIARFHSNAAAISGVSTTAGKVALGAGIVAVVAGLVAWAASGPRLRTASMVVALAAAVAGGAFALSGLSARDAQTGMAVQKITAEQTSAVSGGGSGTAAPGTSGQSGRSGKNGGRHSKGAKGSGKGRVRGGLGVTTATAQLARQGITVSRTIDPGFVLVLAGSLIGIVAGAAGLLVRSAGAGEPAGVPAAPGGPPAPGGPDEATGERDRSAA
jgi:hypothetical protein